MPTPLQRTGSNPVKVSDKWLPSERLRLQRMGRVLRVTGQLLSIDLDKLTIIEGRGDAPAWTAADGAAITIDCAKMPALRGRHDVAVWLGTYAHELFHNLYTPRTDALLM